MDNPWPVLKFQELRDTLETLHRWTQIVGKIRLALAPTTNHLWSSALNVTSRGLATPPMPFGWNTLELELDLTGHALVFRTSADELRSLELRPCAVADFHDEVFETLFELGLELTINERPQEITSEALPLSEDRLHFAYDRDQAHRLWRALASTAIVLEEFRARFTGKCSPVHFFWGAFDLCVTRFSGSVAPPRPGADFVTQEAYHDEVSSAGFWAGDEVVAMPAFYAYFAPAKAGYESATVRPDAASWEPKRGEFVLPYDAVRLSPAPRTVLLEFLQSTFEAGARLGGWDPALERAVRDRRSSAVKRVGTERHEVEGELRVL